MSIEEPTHSPLASKTRSQGRALFLAALTLAGSIASPLRAEDKKGDPAAAEALYMSGRKLVNEGNWTEGCEKFVASMELNAAASTLINIAKCHEHEGKLTQAIIDYRRAIQLNQDTLGSDRKKALEQVAKDGIAALEPKIARVSLSMSAKPEGLEIKRDGINLPLATIGEAIPLDPGAHTFEASAPGFLKEKRELSLKEGEVANLEITLKPEPKTQITDTKLEPKDKPLPVPDKPKPIEPEPAQSGGALWPYVVGGAGLLAIGGGVYFRLDQAKAEQNLVDNCGKELVCDPNRPYRPDEDNARKNRDFYAFVGLTAVGAVGVVAAVIGIATAKPAKKQQTQSLVLSPALGRSASGLVLRGAF